MDSSLVGLKHTPLYEEHVRSGAKFVGFGGWAMPVRYNHGIIEEHKTVRSHAGIFDVSHMGEIRVRGPKALETLQWLTTNDVSKLTPGKAQYSVLPNFEGGVVDDIIVYQMNKGDYLLCVNASNRIKDYQWMLEHDRFGSTIEDQSDDFVLIALQGPNAQPLMEELLGTDLSPEKFPSFAHRPFSVDLATGGILSRTGYTGEDGFELYVSPAGGPHLWRTLLESGKKFGVVAAGLGARDTLRLEAALCLYGHELTDETNVLSAGLGWVTKFEKGDFIGRQQLLETKERGTRDRLVGLELLDPGIARETTPIFSAAGERIGMVTSGTKPPTIGHSIALAYVATGYAEPGTEVVCAVRKHHIRAVVRPIPFYRRLKK